MQRVVRQIIASSIATAIDLALLLGLVQLTGVPSAIAAIAGAGLGGATNFALGRRWVFEARGSIVEQAVPYAALVVGGGALWNGVIVGLASTLLPLVIAKLLAVPLVMAAWTYPVSARIFRRDLLQARACTAGAGLRLTLP